MAGDETPTKRDKKDEANLEPQGHHLPPEIEACLAEVESNRAEERADQELRERVSLAQFRLDRCGDYARPGKKGIPLDRDAPDWRIVLEERTGENSRWPEGNEAFCKEWVETLWVLSVEDVLAVTDLAEVEGFDPGLPAHRVAHHLYLRLLRAADPTEEAPSVVSSLAGIRLRLGAERYELGAYFVRLSSFLSTFGPRVRLSRAQLPQASRRRARDSSAPSRQPATEITEPTGMHIRVSIPSRTRATVSKLSSKGEVVYEAHIGGRSKVQLLRMVMQASEQRTSWRDLLISRMKEDGRAYVSEDTLQRIGRRIKASLGELSCYWNQSMRGVMWSPGVPTLLEVSATDSFV